MKQVCWHSRRSKADRGLPDAETAFEVNMSTRGKAKFGKRHGSRKWEEENSATRRRHRGKGEETAENPSSPHTMCHTPHWASGLVAFFTLYFSNAGNTSAAILWWFLAFAVVLRKGSPASAEASAGICACIGRYVNQNGWFSGPCLATLLPKP